MLLCTKALAVVIQVLFSVGSVAQLTNIAWSHASCRSIFHKAWQLTASLGELHSSAAVARGKLS